MHHQTIQFPSLKLCAAFRHCVVFPREHFLGQERAVTDRTEGLSYPVASPPDSHFEALVTTFLSSRPRHFLIVTPRIIPSMHHKPCANTACCLPRVHTYVSPKTPPLPHEQQFASVLRCSAESDCSPVDNNGGEGTSGG